MGKCQVCNKNQKYHTVAFLNEHVDRVSNVKQHHIEAKNITARNDLNLKKMETY